MKKRTKKNIKKMFLYMIEYVFGILVLGSFEVMLLYGLTISPTIIK